MVLIDYEEILKSVSEISDNDMYGGLELIVEDVFKRDWTGKEF
jgi:hypothetical protein